MSDKKQPEKHLESAKPEKVLTEEEKAEKVREEAAAEARKIAEATLSRYMSWVMKIKGRHAFRGQANAEWAVASSAYRRLTMNAPGKDPTKGLFLGYLYDIVGEARLRFPELGNLSDMEIMAKLQHQGCATGLIDFTEAPLVALWFACQPVKNQDGKNADGRVYAITLDGKKTQEIRNPEILEGKGHLEKFFPVEDRFQYPNFWAWRPGDHDRRMISQQSLLVFGQPFLDSHDYLASEIIPHAYKEEILKLLEEDMGISEKSLFSDFSGYAAANSCAKEYSTRRAEIFLTAAIEKNTVNPYLYLYRGALRYAHNDVGGAQLDYTVGINLIPFRAKKLRELADAKLKEGDRATVFDLGVQEAMLKQLDAEMHNNRGAILCDAKHEYQKAAEDFERAIELKPEEEVTYLNLARVKRLMEDDEGVLNAYTRAIEKALLPAKAHFARGRIRRKSGDYEGALSDYTRVIKINSQDVAAYVCCGDVLADLGRHEEALVDYTRAIELDPQNVAAHNNRGAALRRLNRCEEALVDYARAIEINPQDAMAHSNRGVVLGALGRHEEALVDYTRAIEINPENALAHFNRGVALGDLNRHKEALVDYTRAIELNPQDAGAHFNRGNALAHLNHHEEALVDYTRAIEINPQYAMAHSNRGATLSCLGRREEALVDYARAIELDPQYALVHYNRGKHFMRFGSL